MATVRERSSKVGAWTTSQLRLHAQVVAETMNIHEFAGGYNWCYRFMQRNSFSFGLSDRSPSSVMDKLMEPKIMYITRKIDRRGTGRVNRPYYNPFNDDNAVRLSPTLSGPKVADDDCDSTTTATPTSEPDDTRVNLGPPEEKTPETSRHQKTCEFLFTVCAIT